MHFGSMKVVNHYNKTLCVSINYWILKN